MHPLEEGMAAVFNELEEDALTLPIVCYFFSFYEEHRLRTKLPKPSLCTRSRLSHSHLSPP